MHQSWPDTDEGLLDDPKNNDLSDLDPDSNDPDTAFLVKNGWLYRYEGYGTKLGWWNHSITSYPEPEEWITKDDAVRYQLGIFAGSRRW